MIYDSSVFPNIVFTCFDLTRTVVLPTSYILLDNAVAVKKYSDLSTLRCQINE